MLRTRLLTLETRGQLGREGWWDCPVPNGNINTLECVSENFLGDAGDKNLRSPEMCLVGSLSYIILAPSLPHSSGLLGTTCTSGHKPLHCY